MASLVCSLTGTVPLEPVLSRTGFLFEKRVIEKHLKSTGDICPITGEPLTVADLVEVKNNSIQIPPRPSQATSIPALLNLMQSEWDSLMVETYQLKVHLDRARQQLSHSLYQHDAACRVIARLVKERDAMHAQINELQDQLSHVVSVDSEMAAAPAAAPVVVRGADVGLSAEVIDQWKTLAKSLLNQRRKRNLEGLAQLDQVQRWTELNSNAAIHSSTTPGVTCCAVDAKQTDGLQSQPSRVVWTGGADGLVVLFDIDQQKSLGRLVGHMKRINQILPHPVEPCLLSASHDKTVRVWVSPSGEPHDYKISWILQKHNRSVSNVSLHPSGECFISNSADLTWCINDLNSGQTLKTFTNLPAEFSKVCFHPDGMLVAAAAKDSKIYIYDVKAASESSIVSLTGHSGSLADLQFSENGYYLATASETGQVKLWDLRKSTNFESLDCKAKITKLKFDTSGEYLAVCGSSSLPPQSSYPSSSLNGGIDGFLEVYYFQSKTKLERAISSSSHRDSVTDACFGINADYLISCSLDRTVKLWGPKQHA